MRVIVCGGRNFTDKKRVFDFLDFIHKEYPITELIHGAARGADLLGAAWAQHRGVPIISVPARWAELGPSAGYVRNVKMADMNPDMVIAFPGGKGTAMMMDIAIKRNITVVEG